MQTAAVLAEMAALAEIATVSGRTYTGYGRRPDAKRSMDNIQKPAPGKGFVAESPIKEGEKHRDEEKRRSAALEERDSAARKTSSMKRTAKQRTN